MEASQLGPYQLLAELGSGGMGKVFRAEVTGAVPGLEPGSAVALKVIHAHLLETPGFFKRFLREADIGRTIEHENVVRTYDCDALLQGGVQQNFLVMEYVEGQTLRDLLMELERVPEELCRHIGREVAKGLAAIHEAGVVHRDLKPENVLITPEHEVKIMDLGVARLQAEAVRLSQTGAFVGSLEYAAPEQFRSSDGEPDGRADLHALGLLLYELSTGQHPYRDEDVSKVLRNILEVTPRKVGELNPQLSPFFEEVIHTLIAKERDERFRAASELADVWERGEKGDWWKACATALRVETKRPLRRIRVPRETALYGRDDDLTKLHVLYEKAKGGDGQVLLIEGEAGIGKTRLVDEFVGRLRQEGEEVNFLFGSYPPGGAATAAGAFSGAYREQFGAEGLEETLEDYLRPTPILIPAFAAVLRGETTPAGEEGLTKDSLQTVFVHATRSLAAERTTIVLIDDLHFAPEDGRALFSSLAMAVPGHRILLLGTMRPGVPGEWIANVTRLDHAEQRSLLRLGPKDLAKLLGDAFRSERLAEELAYQIGVKSDGNPFFAFEIIRGLREGQFISQQADGAWVTTRVIQELQVPSSVLDLVNARVADLTEEERDLLDVASCCGFTFDPSLIADAVGVPLVPALKRFGQIERRHRLVRTVGSDCAFDHHQVQEAIYESLMPKLKEAYHAAIAGALEAREGAAIKDPKELDGGLCMDLCSHYLKGAKGEQALRYLHAALGYLKKSYLNGQAIELADRALDNPDLLVGGARVRVLLRKLARLDAMGRREAQRPVISEARTLAEASGEMSLLAEVENATGSLHWATGCYEEALQSYARYRAIARKAGNQDGEAAATINMGLARASLGRQSEAQALLEEGAQLALACGNRRWHANAEGTLGALLRSLGRHEEALEHAERSLAEYREIGDRSGVGNALAIVGTVRWALGLHVEARECFEQSIRISRETGHRLGEVQGVGNLGALLYDLGFPEEARSLVEGGLAVSREIGARTVESVAISNLAVFSKSTGRYADALDYFEQSLTVASDIGSLELKARSLGNLSYMSQLLGCRERARAYGNQCLDAARRGELRMAEAHGLVVLASLAHDEGDWQGAVHQCRQGLAVARVAGDPQFILAALLQLGETHLHLGEHEEAEAALAEALALSDRQGVKALRAEVRALFACLPGTDLDWTLPEPGGAWTDGNTPKIRYYLWKATQDPVHLREAKRLLDELLSINPAAYRESMRKNVRLNREIFEAWKTSGLE